MKRIFYSAIIALSLVLVPSCKPAVEDVDLDITVDNMCGYWVEKEVYMDNHKYNSEGSTTYDLKADGTFCYTNIEESYNGTWKLQDNVFCASHDVSDGRINAEFKINKLTDKTLILENNNIATTYKRK